MIGWVPIAFVGMVLMLHVHVRRWSCGLNGRLGGRYRVWSAMGMGSLRREGRAWIVLEFMFRFWGSGDVYVKWLKVWFGRWYCFISMRP